MYDGRVSYAQWLAALLAVLLAPRGALAQTSHYELDSPDALLDDGFELVEGSSTATFEDGDLRVRTDRGYYEWMLRDLLGSRPSGWLARGIPERGYRIELRMRVIERDCESVV